MDIKLRAACDVDFGFARGVYFETRYRTHAVAPFSMSGNATDQGLASQNVPTSLLTRNNFRLAREESQRFLAQRKCSSAVAPFYAVLSAKVNIETA